MQSYDLERYIIPRFMCKLVAVKCLDFCARICLEICAKCLDNCSHLKLWFYFENFSHSSILVFLKPLSPCSSPLLKMLSLWKWTMNHECLALVLFVHGKFLFNLMVKIRLDEGLSLNAQLIINKWYLVHLMSFNKVREPPF